VTEDNRKQRCYGEINFKLISCLPLDWFANNHFKRNSHSCLGFFNGFALYGSINEQAVHYQRQVFIRDNFAIMFLSARHKRMSTTNVRTYEWISPRLAFSMCACTSVGFHVNNVSDSITVYICYSHDEFKARVQLIRRMIK
jgi:hypothetical protein